MADNLIITINSVFGDLLPLALEPGCSTVCNSLTFLIPWAVLILQTLAAAHSFLVSVSAQLSWRPMSRCLVQKGGPVCLLPLDVTSLAVTSFLEALSDLARLG